MQSKAQTVDEYLLEIPAERIAAIKKLRMLCRQELKGYEERMAYGGPCYSKNGTVEVGYHSQKHFIGLYILKQDIFKKYIKEFKSVTFGKGVIRFSKPENIDYLLVQKMLKGTFQSENVNCG